jgi:hypothetical protein
MRIVIIASCLVIVACLLQTRVFSEGFQEAMPTEGDEEVPVVPEVAEVAEVAEAPEVPVAPAAEVSSAITELNLSDNEAKDLSQMLYSDMKDLVEKAEKNERDSQLADMSAQAPASLIAPMEGFQSYQNPYNSSPITEQSLQFRLGQKTFSNRGGIGLML